MWECVCVDRSLKVVRIGVCLLKGVVDVLKNDAEGGVLKMCGRKVLHLSVLGICYVRNDLVRVIVVMVTVVTIMKVALRLLAVLVSVILLIMRLLVMVCWC